MHPRNNKNIWYRFKMHRTNLGYESLNSHVIKLSMYKFIPLSAYMADNGMKLYMLSLHQQIQSKPNLKHSK